MFCIADIYEKIIELTPADVKEFVDDSDCGKEWSNYWKKFLIEKYPEREQIYNKKVGLKTYHYPKESETEFWNWLPTYFEDLKKSQKDKFENLKKDLKKFTPPLPEDATNTENCFCNTNICFTGFDAAEKIKIEKICKTLNITEVDDKSQKMQYLICGKTAGASKIRRAIENQKCIVPVEYFIEIILEK
jgi:hypothetical protein